MKAYNATEWYWIVAGDGTRVYAADRGDYVPLSDAAFVAWSASNGGPSRIDTAANLGDLLANARAPRPVPADVLAAYADGIASGLARDPMFRVLFNHENRIRVLASQAPLTLPQAIAAFRTLV